MCEDGRTIPLLGRDDALHNMPDTSLVEQAVHRAQVVQLSGFVFRSFADLHRYDAICFAVSSASRRWSSAVRILPVTVVVASTTSLPTSRLRSASMRSCS